MTHNIRLTNGFGQVSNLCMRDPEVSLKEKAIYSYLSTYIDNHTNETTVSVSRIASECGVSQSTVKRSLSILEDKGYIKRTARDYGATRITKLLK